MEKILPLLLILCLLTGCGDAVPPTATQIPPANVEAEKTTSSRKLTYTLDTVINEDSVTADDGTLLATYHYELPRLTARDADGTVQEDASLTAFNEKFSAWVDADFGEMADWARQSYADMTAAGEKWQISYWDEFTYTAYQTDQLVSIAATVYADTGGAHPNTTLWAWNYDLKSGSFVPPTVIAKDDLAFTDAVTGELLRQMDCVAKAGGLPTAEYFWKDYAETVAQWTNYAVSFTEEGMVVAFSPYELACYAAGPQVFTLSTSFLKPFLSDSGRALLAA
ncbi:MAG: DUF3298 domain-containing protein [Oscillospiraceae bacterium]